MAIPTFQWAAGGRPVSPEEAARQRRVAEALIGRTQSPARNWAEGLSHLAGAYTGTVLQDRAAEAEQAGAAEAAALFNGLNSGSAEQDIIAAMSNPWASDQQQSVAAALLGQQFQQADGGAEFFGTTLPWEDAAGNLQYYQLQRGQGLPQLPVGARWLEPTSTVNTGTAQTVVGRNTGDVQGAIPIDNLGANQAQAVGTGLGNMQVEVINAGRAARSNNAKLDILEATLSGAPQGAQGALVQAAGAFGVPLEGLDDVQAAQAIINQLVPLQRLPGSGTMSDADLALFKQSLPSIMNQPGGNKKIIATLRAINDYVERAGDIEWRLASGKINQATANQEYAALPNPLQSYAAATSAPDGATEVSIGGQTVKVWAD